MGVRDGKAYLAGLRDGREVWIDGRRVADVTADPGLGRGAHAIAALFDLQRRPDLRDELTYPSPTTGEPVSLAFVEPRSVDDLVRRRRMFKRWADYSGGMLGRSPDFLRSLVTGLAINRAYLAPAGAEVPARLYAWYVRCREADLCFTHALIAPQRDRGPGYAGGERDPNSLRIVDENADGIVVSGARVLATGAPLADELLVMPAPATVYREARDPTALAIAVPIGTPGLKLICREGLDYGRSSFDHPLGSRFEELDALVVFQEVLVPWERVFIHGDATLAGGLLRGTTAYLHAIHQFMTKHLAKAELILGVATLITRTIKTDGLQHVQAMLGEVAAAVETLYAFIRAAEADAQPDANGVYCPRPATLLAARDYFPTVYPRLIEILQLLGSSGLMAIPTEATFESEIAAEAETYFRSATLGGKERVRLFRLAWDIACSSFGGRQLLYERFFTGDPSRNPATRYLGYDTSRAIALAESLLHREAAPSIVPWT